MEYLPGGELYGVIERRGKIDENKARKYFQQIISAIEYTHTQKVSHRDIKLENVLMDTKDNVKLTDFGLSNYMKDGQFLETCCGTSNYAAPEMISQQKYCGSETDIWSLGVLLYVMLAGFLPFDEPTLPALYEKIKAGEYKIPFHFSPLAEDLIKKCLVTNPLQRITIENIKKHPWCKQFNYFLANGVKLNFFPKVIDQDVFKFLINHPIFSEIKCSEEKLKEIILNRNSFHLFSTSYEMMIDNKSKSLQNFEYCRPVFSNTEFYLKPSVCPSDWNFCVKAPKSLHDLMTFLFEILKEFELEWKIVEKFKIRVRTVNVKEVNVPIEESNREPGCKYLKFQVTLYSHLDMYLFDFRLIIGETLNFFDFIAKIYKRLHEN